MNERANRHEEGYVIVVVLLMLLIALAFSAAALSGALDSRTNSNRDTRVRRAQQAADAGIQAQLYQQSQVDLGTTSYNFNGGPLGLSTFLDCNVPQLNASLQVTGIVSAAANAAGVCPIAVDPNKNPIPYNPGLGNHTSYQAEMLTSKTNLLNGTMFGSQNGSAGRELFPKIVAIGSDDTNLPAGSGTVYSREEAILAPIAPLQAIEGSNSVTIEGLSLLGIPIASVLNGDVLSRGDLTTPAVLAGLNLSNGLIATLAYGGTLHGGLSVANVQPVSSSKIIKRPPVAISSSKPDCPTAGCPTGYTGTAGTNAHNFSISSGSVTFQPGDYVFCNFSATGGTVNINASASTPVRIFIDSPTSTRCSGDSPPKGNFNDPTGFNNQLLGIGGVVNPSGMQVYVVGDGSYDSDTTVQIGPTSTGGLLSLGALTYGAIVYAPTSKVVVRVPASCVLGICTGGIFSGSVIGNDTTVSALTITQDLDIGNYPLYAGVNAYRPLQYVQCDTSVTSLTRTAADFNGC
jgi:Tfp pilus assembly protein PilX